METGQQGRVRSSEGTQDGGANADSIRRLREGVDRYGAQRLARVSGVSILTICRACAAILINRSGWKLITLALDQLEAEGADAPSSAGGNAAG